MTGIPSAARGLSHVRTSGLILSVATLSLASVTACKTEPKTVALQASEVERQWRRTVGEPRLELPPPRTGIAEAGVVVSFRPVATVEQIGISRAFEVTWEATVLRKGRSDESPVDLSALAAAEVVQRYPAIASNAEAAIEPTEVTIRDVVLEVDGRSAFGDLRISIEPQPPVFEAAKPTRLAVSEVQVVAARLVDGGGSGAVLIEGELLPSNQPGEQRLVFPIDRLDSSDCRRLRSLFLGDYAVEADCEIRTGARSVVAETRTFPAGEEREWRDPVRRAAGERLAALASASTGADLSMELRSEYAVRGEQLPDVIVVNRSAQPILDLRTFLVTHQIQGPDGLRFVGSGTAEGEPCLCPGEAIAVVTPEALESCGESVGGGAEASHGLILQVSASGLERRRLGPLPVVAVDASGAQLSPPRTAGSEVVVEATSSVEGRNLQLRLSIEGEGEIVVPFPRIEAGGRATVVLPSVLEADAAAVWEGWRGSGRRVEVELLEEALWGCEGATPARQAFRMSS